jgi:hypothetical protein
VNGPLLIEYANSKGKHQLLFSGNGVQGWHPDDRVVETASPEALANLAGILQNDLTTLRQSLQHKTSLAGQEKLVGRSLTRFCQAGVEFWKHFVEGDPTMLLSRLRGAVTMGLPQQWWIRPAHEIAAKAGTVEVKGPRKALLPIDALPLGDPELLSYAADQSEILALASYFGGYCCVVRYVSYGTDDDDPPPGGQRSARSMLPPAPTTDPDAVVCLRSMTAPLYKDTADYLRDHRWRVLGLFPESGKLEDGLDIARCLLNPEAMPVPGSSSYVLPGIAHIHAHANSYREFARNLSVEFRYESKATELTSADVQLVKNQLKQSPPNSCGPLVVFSACDAQGELQPPLVNTAFDLAEAGCRAVIGPRNAIPEGLAYAFSRDLYTGLRLGDEVGRAVMWCRWNLLKALNNPLGILYSVFGNTAKL